MKVTRGFQNYVVKEIVSESTKPMKLKEFTSVLLRIVQSGSGRQTRLTGT